MNTQNIPEFPIYAQRKTGEKYDRNLQRKVPIYANISYAESLRYISNVITKGKKVRLYGVGPFHGARAYRIMCTLLRAECDVTDIKILFRESTPIMSFVVDGNFEFQERQKTIASIFSERITNADEDNKPLPTVANPEVDKYE